MLDMTKTFSCVDLQELLKAWGSVLKRKVAKISTSSRETCLAPSDACRGYALYAANSLLQRCASLSACLASVCVMCIGQASLCIN